MTSFDAELTPCFLCRGDKFKKISSLVSPIIEGFRQNVMMCQRCGFVMLNPLLKDLSYEQLNTQWYQLKYSDDAPARPLHDKFSKWEKMSARCSDFALDFSRLLDVGAGQGWAIEYLKREHRVEKAVAIEQSDVCRDHISKNLGADAVNVDISENWCDRLGDQRFSFVICRHVLEHLKNPRHALSQIRYHLTDTGFAYVVVPNLTGVRNAFPLKTDFFRPVHLSYFDLRSFTLMAHSCGLDVKASSQPGEGEVWCVLSRRQHDNADSETDEAQWLTAVELRLKTRGIKQKLRQAWWADLKNIAKIAVRKTIKNIPR